MLSVKNLVKIYKTKGGVEVRALDGVTVDFPSKGMVFLLGKSGSGKSTLLNVTGGLDVPTDGEVIVKGKSSKEFQPSDWDSYRNTYIGFVFQEYNILNEFTVEQNIALALQLQNKNNDKEAVREILKEVDLEGYEKRKPNTLSGGQRQRVAIARALIKKPEIIMADEPTGALDSETGKQVFDTLKKLSESRLVIVVSHDRDFAETYADRIIELEDGKVIEDNSREISTETEKEENVSVYDNETITVKDWKNISKEDIEKIISIMAKTDGETVITKGEKEITEIKKNRKNVKLKKAFKKTGKTDGTYTGEPAKFIKSKLPFVHALKVAGGAIKEKPIRLAFTILLSILAFTFFGVASTLMLYNPYYSISTALENSTYDAYVVQKEYQAEYLIEYLKNGEVTIDKGGKVDFRGAYTKDDITALNNNDKGIKFDGLIDFGSYSWNEKGYSYQYQTIDASISSSGSIPYNDKFYYSASNISGFYDGDEKSLEDKGFTLIAGKRPENAYEIAVSKYHSELLYKAYGFSYDDNGNMDYSKLFGQTINLYYNMTLTIVGVYDVGEVNEKFNVLKDKDLLKELSPIEKASMQEEMRDYIGCSYHSVVFVSEDFYDTYIARFRNIPTRTGYGIKFGYEKYEIGLVDDRDTVSAYTKNSLWKYENQVKFFDFNGNITDFNLAKDELLIDAMNIASNASLLASYIRNTSLEAQYSDFLTISEKIYKQDVITCDEMSIVIKTLVEASNNPSVPFTFEGYNRSMIAGNSNDEYVTFKTVGFYFIEGSTSLNYMPFVSDEFMDEFSLSEWQNEHTTNTYYALEKDIDVLAEKYGKLITLTDGSYDQAYYVVSCGDGFGNAINNNVYTQSESISSTINMMKLVFSIVTLVFAIFASLMLFNFISVSITSKTKETGILRAIGARGTDIFKIFIIEALIITGICFVLSAVASYVICTVINNALIGTMVGMSILRYGILSVLMLIAMTLFISFASTISPVIKASKKSPVDSIRTL